MRFFIAFDSFILPQLWLLRKWHCMGNWPSWRMVNVWKFPLYCNFYSLLFLNVLKATDHFLFQFVVVTVCFKALLECDSWTWITLCTCAGSILSWFIFIAIYSLVIYCIIQKKIVNFQPIPQIWPFFPIGAEMNGMFGIMVSSPNFWIALIFIPASTLLFDFIVKRYFLLICTEIPIFLAVFVHHSVRRLGKGYV